MESGSKNNEKKLKIVQWNSAVCWGGAEIRLTETCKYLKSRGHDIYVVCQKNTPLFKWMLQNNYSVAGCAPRNSIDLFRTLQVAININRWKADVIHVHTGRDYVPAIVSGIINNCPVIIHRHLLGPLNIVTRWLIKKWKVLFISVSEKVTETLYKIDKFPKDRINTIKNAIDPSRMNYSKNDIDKIKKEFNLNNKRVILSIGNLYPSKGHDDLIESIGYLRKSGNLILLIAGEGPEKKRLKSLIEELELNNCVKLLGRREDIPALLNICDCLALLSWEDPFPGAIIEAFASGKPVIGCNAGGVPEMIKDGKTGFLVPPHNPEKAADILNKLLSDGFLIKTMGENAKKDFNERFDINVMINKIENVYYRLTPDKIPVIFSTELNPIEALRYE